MTALLGRFKTTGRHVALVSDEFGGISGLVSLHDIMEAIVGELPSLEDRLRSKAVRRDDGSWLVDGLLDIEEFTRTVTGFPLPPAAERDYETLGAFSSNTSTMCPPRASRAASTDSSWRSSTWTGSAWTRSSSCR